ncbi:MAG TPA: histidine kinase [Bryobacteraceae bacterium]|nr:histidine kinase [Bryobacteraceae bacterium]
MPGGLENSVNTLGHAAGVLIFGHFLVLSIWNQPAHRLRANRLAILAAALALLWNLASFAVLVSGDTGGNIEQVVAIAGFCVLSLLPAVLLHLCLASRFPLMVRLGYVLSTISIGAHLLELTSDSALYHRAGLATITIGFGILTVASTAGILWPGGDHPRLLSSRLLAGMSLFLFAISFVHFSEGQAHHAWSTELIFHHAGIPLALFVLLQDHRFVLADTFIRLLANGGVAGLLAFGLATASAHLNFVGQVLLGGMLLVIFGKASGPVQRFLSRMVFRQKDPGTLLRDLRALASRTSDEVSYVEESSRLLAQFMGTEVIDIPQTLRESNLPGPVLVTEVPESKELQRHGVQAVVPVRLTHGVTRSILLAGRVGGRRYLGDDLHTLARAAACVAEEADHIRETEMRRLVTQAELRALQSQIHPHFLFNALNAIYGIIPREVKGARRMLLNLADVFRYFLQTDRTYVALEEELRIVKAYLAIEELRLGDQLRISIDVDESALGERIPVLSVQPLVENAVKHGAAVCPQGGQVRIEIRREPGGLQVRVSDTGPGFAAEEMPGDPDRAGVGLENVSRRLQLCYGRDAGISVENRMGWTTVSFFAPCPEIVRESTLRKKAGR